MVAQLYSATDLQPYLVNFMFINLNLKEKMMGKYDQFLRRKNVNRS